MQEQVCSILGRISLETRLVSRLTIEYQFQTCCDGATTDLMSDADTLREDRLCQSPQLSLSTVPADAPCALWQA